MNPQDYLKLPLEKKRAIIATLAGRNNGESSLGSTPAAGGNGAAVFATQDRSVASPQPAENSVGEGTKPTPPNRTGKRRTQKPLDFSLLFFSKDDTQSEEEKYLLVRECAQFADENGFKAVWVPERHFHPFGGIYPNPAVLCAALAASTRHIRLRAGSVVLPLQHPLRVAEAWSMVDNLSGGRVDISFASGWNPNDFVLSQDTYARSKEVLIERLQEVRKLWRGDTLKLRNGKGELVDIRIFPKPLQRELPVWMTAAGNPDTFQAAGRFGCNLLTMLFSTTLEELAKKISLYRQARTEDSEAEGIVTLMLHAFVQRDLDVVRSKVREPFMSYIRSSIDVQRHGQGQHWEKAELDRMADFAYERYFRTGALFGTPETCLDLLQQAAESGVDEVACQVDFGVDTPSVLESLIYLKELKERHELSFRSRAVAGHSGLKEARTSDPNPARTLPSASSRKPLLDDAIAIIGVSGRFPESPDLEQFWDNLAAGRDLMSEAPADRWLPEEGSIRYGAWLKDVDAFDAPFFNISDGEAASMDPHQRQFLETVWATLEDAGYPPGKFGSARVGLFVGMYSPDYNHLVGPDLAGADSQRLTGRLNVMVPNRVSHLLDLRGPSELVDTACSSSLVAIHRAMQAIASGDCDLAVAGGISLLLSAVSTKWLGQVELLSKDGKCRPFDARANGLVRGEGTGAVLLKPLRQAVADRDHVYAVVRASAVNHNGRSSGALTTPSASAQAELLVDAYRRGAVEPGSISYIEAHGAASDLGDYVEISAFKRAFAQLAPQLARRSCGIGSLKANIGALDAAGGIAGVIKVLLALQRRQWPATAEHMEIRPDLELGESPFYFVNQTETWQGKQAGGAGTGPRRAAVHAYGLGGVNAHVVLEEFLEEETAQAGQEISPSGSELILLSARDPDRLQEMAMKFRRWLDRPRASLQDVAHTLQVGRTAFPERLAIVAASYEDLKHKLDSYLRGKPSGGIWLGHAPQESSGSSPLSRTQDWPTLAEAWISGAEISWVDLHSTSTRRLRRVPLPTYPFSKTKYRLPVRTSQDASLLPHPLLDAMRPRVGGAVFTKSFHPGDPMVADHRYRGKPLVPAAAMCEMVRAAGQLLDLGEVRRLEGLAFLHPLEVIAPVVKARIQLQIEAGAGHFEITSDSAPTQLLHSSGRICWDVVGALPGLQRLDLAEVKKLCPREVTGEELYQEFSRLGIEYGASFRCLQQAWFNEREVLGKISLAPGLELELSEYVLHPSLLDALLELSLVFALGRNPVVQLPFSIELLELARPLVPDGMAYLQRTEIGEPSGVSRFHGVITDQTGRVLVKVRDLCLKQATSNGENSAAWILSQLASGAISVEAADQLLGEASLSSGAPEILEIFGAELSHRTREGSFRFALRFSPDSTAETWTLEVKPGKCTVLPKLVEPSEGMLTLSAQDLKQLMKGELDPTVLLLQCRVSLQPETAHGLRQKIGALWFERFNCKHLPHRFKDHSIGRIYESGDVTASSGIRREIFPWTLSADAGAVLYGLVLREKLDATLEIGMAYGLSSLFICQAHQDKGGGKHVAIDPGQRQEFLSIGLENIQTAGLNSYLQFMDEPDYLALPQLLREGREFRMVFIDGLHMFDYTLLDFFYGDRLLAENGILIFDDCLAPGVAKAIAFMKNNRHYEPLDLGCARLAGFRKQSPDTRSLDDPNFHREF